MSVQKKIKFKQNIFNKLLLTSSLTIIVTVLILFILITKYYSDVIIQQEIDTNVQTLERINDYFEDKEINVTNMVRDLYSNEYLINDLTYALEHGYEEYYKYRLDRFMESEYFMLIDMNTFFNNFVDQHSDANALGLYSDEMPEIKYLYIYNYTVWNQLINSDPELKAEDQTNDLIIYKNNQSKRLKDTFVIERNLKNPIHLKSMGNLTVYYSTNGIKRLIDQRKSDVESTIFILNNNKDLLFSSNENLSRVLEKEISFEKPHQVIKNSTDTYYVNILHGHNDFTYISILPQRELNKLTLLKGTMGIFAAFSVIMAIFITYSTMRNYSLRISHIDSSIKEVEKGNLSIRVKEFKQKDELTTIAKSINSMLDELNSYIDRFYVANIKQREAEMKALQSQINPHFLFNTLEVIRMTAVLEGSKTSSQMIFLLAKLFRYTLEDHNIVSLYTEVDHTNQYLQLIQHQYPGKLKVNIDVPKQLENAPIQKLILQPIVENYMIHGFRKSENDNYLLIQAREERQTIYIKIEDNGKGIPNEKLKSVINHLNDETNTGDSIGLKNVHQRLRLKYGSEFGLSIQSIEGEKTVVIIRIPSREA